MPESPCPNCGAPLPDHAPGGQCPRCLLMRGLDSDPPDRHRGSSDPTVDHDGPGRAGSVLETIAATVGAVPRILLRDTAVGETPSPVVRPSGGPDPASRYRIDGEIARGGMGSILMGRDPDLGRDVAIKVLRDDLRDDKDLIRGFVEEAQIGGQLQHPGVVPIYELGTFADRRPYFAMKLVKGKTLADRLATRLTPADDLPRFHSMFQAIALTMAYSHTRGVIHRDLKPSNVMVGSFGEVQVMDWGLAKVLAHGGAVDDAKAGKEPPPETLIATARSGSDSDLSHPGSILGTPSYMPPEQARGEVDRVDERADVFAMGSILVEILTGSPAFTGRSSGEILRKAARGDTAPALARLDGCGAEAELIALARDCLEVEPEDRPRDATVVADRIATYLAGVQHRVQAAERERAVAVARAIEERRRRKVQLALAASVLALATLGGLSASYYIVQRETRATAVERVVAQAAMLRNQAEEDPEDLARWQVALAAVEQAEAGGDEAARPRLLALRQEVQAGLEAARRDRALLDRLVDIRSAEADDPDGSATEPAYADAFREAEIDLAVLEPAEAGARIRARPESVALNLVGALDDWAAIRRVKRKDAAGAARLGVAAREADPDPWRNELRVALNQPDKAARLAGLQALAGRAKFGELGPISLHLLGTGLDNAGDRPLAESVLRAAQRRHPGDVWVNYALGAVLKGLGQRDEAIRFYTAARSIHPETAHELAHALEDRGDSDEALAVFRDLKKLRPGNARHLGCLGSTLKSKGLLREADETLDEAAAAGREAIRLQPEDADAHYNLGNALSSRGQVNAAIEAYREAIRLRPGYAEAHYNLGVVLAPRGEVEAAMAAYREAIRLRPGYAEAHCNLGSLLMTRGQYGEALEMRRKGHELGSRRPDWRYPSSQWVAEAERSLALFHRLPAVLRGEDQPGDNAERLEFAMMAHGRKQFAAAARLFAEALQADPKLSEDRQARHRYNAACFAALAGVGQGKDDPPPDDEAKAKLRRQARDWLKAEREVWELILEPDPPGAGFFEKMLESAPSPAHAAVVRTLSHWKKDPDLAGIRDPEALARLPESEREEFRAFWAEVDALLERARRP